MYGKRSTSALLSRVNSQLRGEKVSESHQEENEDDLDAYLSTIGKKKTKTSQPQWDKFGELSDLSISEDEKFKTGAGVSGSGSKFLKKKAPPQTKKPSPRQNQSSAPKAKPSNVSTAKSHSGALGKAAMFSHKYGKPAGSDNRFTASAVLSDSDLDMSLSPDTDIVSDVKSWKKSKSGNLNNQRPSQKSTSFTKGGGKTFSSMLADSSDDSSSMQIGKGGSKFLKKKPVAQPATNNNKENIPEKIRPKQFTSGLKPSEKFSARLMIDTDDDSMPEIFDDTPIMTPRTPRTPRSSGLEDVTEEDEPRYGRRQTLDSETDDVSSVSSEDGFKLNVMDLDDLQPVMELKTSKSSKSHASKKSSKSRTVEQSSDDDDVFKLHGLQTVDDLLPAADDRSVGGVTSEIRTEADDQYESDFDPLSRSSQMPLKSILSTTPRNITPRSSRSRVRYSLAEVMEIRSRSPSPEVISTARGSRTESVIHTEEESSIQEVPTEATTQSVPEEEDYSEDYTEDFSSSGLSSPERTPRRQDSVTGGYSDDWTSATETTPRRRRRHSRRGSAASSRRESVYSDDYTSYTESEHSRASSPERRSSPVATKTMSVQTGADMGLMYHWTPSTAGSAALGPQYGMAFVDPAPIASHVVSADALEAVTAFSPSVVALNDMLKQQLSLMNQFVTLQRRTYESYANIASESHQYTTLQDHKEYVKKHKKPTLTFKQALKQVKREMGMKH